MGCFVLFCVSVMFPLGGGEGKGRERIWVRTASGFVHGCVCGGEGGKGGEGGVD